MTRHYDRFTQPFAGSPIPFLLAEVITNGAGSMVDAVCRWVNDAGASLLDAAGKELENRRFCQLYPPERLEVLAPLEKVAFSGSSASFSCETVLGRQLTVTCYQVLYGLCACILQEAPEQETPCRSVADLVADHLPGCATVLEVGRNRLRSLTLSRQLWAMTGYSQREFLNRFAGDLSPLVEPEDWQPLLQCLLDAAHGRQAVSHEFRLVQKDGSARWVSLRGAPLSTGALPVFHVLLLDIHRQKQLELELARAREALAAVSGTAGKQILE